MGQGEGPLGVVSPLQAAHHAQRSEQSGQGGDYHLDDGLNDFLFHIHSKFF